MNVPSRIVNLGYFLGLVYFEASLSLIFVIKRARTLFTATASMAVIAMVIGMIVLGAALAIFLSKKINDERISNVISTLWIIAFPIAFLAINIRMGMVPQLLCFSLCGIMLGYPLSKTNGSVGLTLHLDKHAGMILAVTALTFGTLAFLIVKFNLVFQVWITIFLLLIYYFCRPPIRFFKPKKRHVRNDLDVVATPRSVFTFLFVVSIFGVRCGAENLLFIPTIVVDRITVSICVVLIFGCIGVIVAGILWGMLSRYLPMLAFCAVCISLAGDSIFGMTSTNITGQMLRYIMDGVLLLYFMCSAANFPTEGKTNGMLNRMAIVFAIAVAVSIVLLANILKIPGGRTILATISVVARVVVLMQLFYSNIYQSNESPAFSFDVRLDQFKREFSLTARENEVLAAVLESEKSMKLVAADLFISLSTLEKHMTNIYKKTHTKNRAELIHSFFSDTNPKHDETTEA